MLEQLLIIANRANDHLDRSKALPRSYRTFIVGFPKDAVIGGDESVKQLRRKGSDVLVILGDKVLKGRQEFSNVSFRDKLDVDCWVQELVGCIRERVHTPEKRGPILAFTKGGAKGLWMISRSLIAEISRTPSLESVKFLKVSWRPSRKILGLAKVRSAKEVKVVQAIARSAGIGDENSGRICSARIDSQNA